jgi:hypothetical protein
MERGYELLAEAFVREKRFNDAIKAVKKLSNGKPKQDLLREVRNNAVKTGNLSLYRQTSEMAELSHDDQGDIATMLLANLDKADIEALIELLSLMPENSLKEHLQTTVKRRANEINLFPGNTNKPSKQDIFVRHLNGRTGIVLQSIFGTIIIQKLRLRTFSWKHVKYKCSAN